MSNGAGVLILLMIVLAMFIFIIFLSLYSSSYKRTGRKKIVEVNLDVRPYFIHSVEPVLKGKRITLTGPGRKLRFIVDDNENPGYRVGQKVMVAMTDEGPKLLKSSAQQSHILFQVK